MPRKRTTRFRVYPHVDVGVVAGSATCDVEGALLVGTDAMDTARQHAEWTGHATRVALSGARRYVPVLSTKPTATKDARR